MNKLHEVIIQLKYLDERVEQPKLRFLDIEDAREYLTNILKARKSEDKLKT